MSARTLRRTFAAPFVATLAFGAPVSADTPKTAAPPDHVNPPSPDRPPLRSPQRWTITKNTAKGAKPADCLAAVEVTCPKPEPGKPAKTCNPPAPITYTCPTGDYGIGKEFTASNSLKVILRPGATQCVIDREPVKCPPGPASCNPPPPKKIACPK